MASTIVNSLPEYVATRDDLIVKAALGAKTLDYIAIYPNVKYKTQLNALDSTVVFADGNECGFNAQGTDTVSDRTLEVNPIKINKEWCPADLRKSALNNELLIAAGRETMPYEEKFVEANLNAIEKELDKAIWQGNGALIDGFIAQIEDASAVAKVVELSAGASAKDVIDGAYQNLTADALGHSPVIFVSQTMFSQYVQALNAECCANRTPYDIASGEIAYPNDSRVRIIPVYGLEGEEVAVAGPADGFAYGTDVEGSEAVYDLWFDRSADMFRLKVLFNAGTALVYPDEVVLVEVGE